MRFPETLWASMPVPALLLDPGDMIAEVNPAAEDFLVASSRTLRGAPVFNRISIDAPMESALVRVRADHAPLFINNVDVGAGHRARRQCNLQIAPMIGMPGFVLVMFEPRKLVDRTMRTSARSAIGMSEMLAHEIKNPLAGITGAAQLLGMELEAEDRALTDLIVEESRRIVALLDQVEQFGNLRPPARRAINVHDLLDRARRTAAVGFASHMRLAEEYDPSLPPTYVDGDQFLQVFLNLIRNATEAAGPEGGTITVRTFYDLSLRVRRKDGTGAPLPLQVEIVDDGPGLPPEIAADIFEPFVSGRENGTGLGLALVGKIVGDHDGWITVDSQPGRTVFRISLPVAPETVPGLHAGRDAPAAVAQT